MRKNYIIFTICMLILLVAYLSANVTGNWEMTIETGKERVTSEIEFRQEDEKLFVIMQDRADKVAGEGFVKGNKIEWTISRKAFLVVFVGTIGDNDNMSGQVSMGKKYGVSDWYAKRK